jgi:hypothetical protein
LSILIAGCAVTTIDPSVKNELAPTGTLRVAVNYGNPVHTQRNPPGASRSGSRPISRASLRSASACPSRT